MAMTAARMRRWFRRGAERPSFTPRRVFVVALTVSVFAHLLALGGVPWSSSPALDVRFPIEARLVAAPAPVVDIPPPPPPPPPRRPSVPVIAEPPPSPEEMAEPVLREDQAEQPADETPMAEESVAGEPIAEAPVSSEPSPPEPTQTEPSPPEPQAVAMSALRALPARAVLRYAVQTGEGGFTLGRSTITWTLRDGRYVLESVTEASGVTALLVRGRIAQRSEGRVTDTGLRPERFAMERGKRSPQNAEFDWARARLHLRGGEVELPAQAQDVLGFPFHLAMVLRGDEAPWRMAVTDGRKLREYDFRVVDRVPPPRAERFADVVHLRGSRAGDGSLDVWLAPSLHWLPVRIRTLDDKGRAMVLNLEAEDLE